MNIYDIENPPVNTVKSNVVEEKYTLNKVDLNKKSNFISTTVLFLTRRF